MAIMRMDDSHLLFYVSVFICPEEGGRQTTEVSTWVKYHNRIGRVYFFFIKPFHRVIVPLVSKRVLIKE